MASNKLVMLGTMTFGNQVDEAESHRILDEFVKLGGVEIDTAELYPVPPTVELIGKTEYIIGNWLSSHPGMREKVKIATKVAGPTPSNNALKKREETLTGVLGTSDEQQDFTPAQIKRACEGSLKRLQTDYIDLYQLHWPSRPTALWGKEVFTRELSEGKYPQRAKTSPNSREGIPIDVIVTCMGELLKSGKIRTWGLSNETAFGVVHFCEAAKRLGVDLPVTIQNDFSLADRRFDGQLAEATSYYGIKLLAYGPLAGGFFSGKYLDNEDSVDKKTKIDRKNWRHEKFPEFQPRYYAKATSEAAKKYAQVAKKHNITLIELALGFCATRYYMGSVIIGATSVEQMVENFHAVMNGEKNITGEVMKEIDAIHAELPNPNACYTL